MARVIILCPWLTFRFRIQGGGIVFDSVEEDEYIETINKLGANVRCIDAAEGECAARCLKYAISLMPSYSRRVLRQDGRH